MVAVLVELLTGLSLIPQDTTHQLIGVNSLLKSATKSARQDRDKKGEPGGTNKCTIGDISVEQVTAIIGAIQQHKAATDAAESTTPKTSNNQAGNAFGGKEGAKKQRAGGE
jgi:hypothetical protein